MEGRPVQSRGFHNIGVHCYANSAMQLLFHSPIFLRWLGKIQISHRVECQKVFYGCTLCQLITLYRDYFGGPVQQPLSVISLLTAMKLSCWKAINLDKTQCLYEFLHILIGHLQDEYDLCDFQLELLERKTCLSCNAISSSVPSVADNFIRVSMQGNSSLTEAIHSKLESAIAGTDTRPCASCQKVTPHHTDEKFIQVPNILMTTIENNYIPYMGYQRTKIQNRLALDFIGTDNIEIGVQPYVLQGLIYHINYNETKVDRYGGHYISICKESDGNYYTFDDLKVIPLGNLDEIGFSAPVVALYEKIQTSEMQLLGPTSSDPSPVTTLADGVLQSTLAQIKADPCFGPIIPNPPAIESVNHLSLVNPRPSNTLVIQSKSYTEVANTNGNNDIEMGVDFEASKQDNLNTNVVTLAANSTLVFHVSNERTPSGTKEGTVEGQPNPVAGDIEDDQNMDFIPPINKDVRSNLPTKSDIFEVILHSLMHLESFRDKVMRNKRNHLDYCPKVNCKMCSLLTSVTKFIDKLKKNAMEVRIPLHDLAAPLYDYFEEKNDFESCSANTASVWLINHISNNLKFLNPLFEMTYQINEECNSCNQVDLGPVVRPRFMTVTLHEDIFNLRNSILEDTKQQLCVICNKITIHTTRKCFTGFPKILAISIHTTKSQVDMETINIPQQLMLPSQDGISTTRYEQRAWIYENNPLLFTRTKYYAMCIEDGSLYMCDGENRIKLVGGPSCYEKLPMFLLYELIEPRDCEKCEGTKELSMETGIDIAGFEPPLLSTPKLSVVDQNVLSGEVESTSVGLETEYVVNSCISSVILMLMHLKNIQQLLQSVDPKVQSDQILSKIMEAYSAFSAEEGSTTLSLGKLAAAVQASINELNLSQQHDATSFLLFFVEHLCTILNAHSLFELSYTDKVQCCECSYMKTVHTIKVKSIISKVSYSNFLLHTGIHMDVDTLMCNVGLHQSRHITTRTFNAEVEPDTLIIVVRYNQSESVSSLATKYDVILPENIKLSSKGATYKLMTVLLNERDNATPGHHFAYCKKNDGNFYLCKNETITQVSTEQVLKCQPVVVMYENEKIHNSINNQEIVPTTQNKEPILLPKLRMTPTKPCTSKEKRIFVKNQCLQCPKTFVSKADLKHHLIKNHGTEEEKCLAKLQNVCETCQKSYYTTERLRQHCRESHALKKFKCRYENCNFSTNKRYELNRHMRSPNAHRSLKRVV